MPRRPTPPKPTLVFLVRHASTPSTGKVLPGRAKGLHLSEQGHKQAATVAQRLARWSHGAKRSITALYCSPLERTRETAAPIAEALGLRAVTHKGLLECDFGDWTGAELPKLAKLPEWTAVQRHPSGFRFPRGESFLEMSGRIQATLSELVRAHPGEAVVAVSHADTIKAAVAAALGTHLDLFQRIVISPCSISAIAYSTSGPAVLAVNSTCELEELRVS